MKKRRWLGVLAFAPPILLFLGIIGMIFNAIVVSFTAVSAENGMMAEETAAILAIVLMVLFFVGYAGIFLAVILVWVDVIWYIVLACKNPEFDTTQKVLWAIGIYSLNMFICPVYWWMYIKSGKQIP